MEHRMQEMSAGDKTYLIFCSACIMIQTKPALSHSDHHISDPRHTKHLVPLTLWSVFPCSYLCTGTSLVIFVTTSLGLTGPNIVFSSCALLVFKLILSGVNLRGIRVLHDTVTIICSVLDAVDYLHHGIVYRDLTYVCFPLSHLPPFTYLTHPRTSSTSSTDPVSDVVIVELGMQVYFPPLTSLYSSLHRAELPYSSPQVTHLSFGYVTPEVIRNADHRKLVHKYDRFHTHTQTKHKLIALSLHSLHHLCLPLRLSPIFVSTTPLPSLSKTLTPKWNFRVHTGTRFRSSRVLHPTSRLPQFTPASRCTGGFTWSFAYPYHYRRHVVPHRFLPHPPTRLNSQSNIRAANSLAYFVATTTSLSTQSNKWWHNQDLNLRVGTQAMLKEEW